MKLGQPNPTATPAGQRNIPADQASYTGLRQGDLLDGRFQIVETINHGGMATVFKAEDRLDHGQPVAIKVPHAKYATGLGAWSRLNREEEIASHLQHPYVLRFVPVPGRQHGTYIVTELLRGETLADRLERTPPLRRRRPSASRAECLRRCSICTNIKWCITI